ncbi:MAG TPA: hypothetical protein VGQ71_08615 [Terriglobales bacterium]|nr:hypothetical protein [Terriglobales bacterium]
MSIYVLYAILVLCTVAVLGVTLVIYCGVRRQMRASDTALRETLQAMEQDRETTRI